MDGCSQSLLHKPPVTWNLDLAAFDLKSTTIYNYDSDRNIHFITPEYSDTGVIVSYDWFM